MKFTHRAVESGHVLTLDGRFDAYEVPAMNEWFEQHPAASHVVVNLAAVGFIDSSGLAALVKGLKRCRENGGELVLCELQQAVRIIIELTRLDKAFHIFDSEADAIQHNQSQLE